LSGIILYIEHNEENLLLVRKAIEGIGLTLFCARSGEEGLASAWRLRPAVILLGLNLPDMDAYQAARTLRRQLDEGLRCIPIIAVSAGSGAGQPGEADRAIAAGCDAYLPQPININRLWETVETFLSVSDFC